MTIWTLAMAGLLLAAAGGGSSGATEDFFVVTDDALIRDATGGNPLGPLLRGSYVWRKKGESDFRTYAHWGKRIAIDASAIVPKDEAGKFFDERLRTKSNAADYADRASLRMSEGRHADALNDLNLALNLQPDMYRAYLRRSECRLRRAATADAKARTRWLELSLEDAEKCVELKPDEFLSYDARFQPLASIDRARAFEDAAKVLELRPGHGPLITRWAKLLLDAGRRDEAIEKLGLVLKLDPEYSDAYVERGVLHRQAGRLPEAVADAAKAIEFDPRNQNAWSNRGLAYLETMQVARAVHDFSEVIRIAPDASNGYSGRAAAYLSMGRERREIEKKDPAAPLPDGYLPAGKALEQAAADCRHVIERNPRDVDCRLTLGNVLKLSDKPREAVEMFDRALSEIEKQSRENGLTVPDENGHRVDAWDAVEKVLQFAVAPEAFDGRTHQLALSHPHRATIAAVVGSRADARRLLANAGDPNEFSLMLGDLTRAILFDPRNAEYFRVRGEYNLEFKRYPQALSDLNQAITLRPNYVQAMRGRIIAATELGRFDLAWDDVHLLESLASQPDEKALERLKEASGREK
jgi:tetratricopeptide (TPR) repeat protein